MIKLGGNKKATMLYIYKGNEKRFPKEIKPFINDAKEYFKDEKEAYFFNNAKTKVLIIKKELDKHLLKIRDVVPKALKYDNVFYYIPNPCIRPVDKQVYAVLETFEIAAFKFNKFKEKKDKKENIIYIDNKFKDIAKKASIVAKAVNYTRELANTPPNVATPEYMVNEAKKLSKTHKFNIKVYDKNELKKIGANAILAVNAASSKGAYIVHITYKPKKAKKKIAVVGKGITFDTGGLGLKPAKYMLNMHLDKSGACAVLGIMKAAAELKLNIELHGFLALTENAIGKDAIQPNSIVKSYSGKTIEIQHTDAEGRLILADVVALAEKTVKPDYILDLATLTGAMSVILGDKGIGVFSNNEKLAESFKHYGYESGERAWPLPMWEDYAEMLKSDVADIKNIGSWEGDAGSITAAKFIEAFIKKTTFIHLDIASTMDSGYSYMESKQATGAGVRLVIKFLESI